VVANVYVYAAQEVRITILQTTDLHHHANGADHIGLDVDPVSGASVIGAYARIAAYVNYVRMLGSIGAQSFTIVDTIAMAVRCSRKPR
jgi:2',3'-cyclic-nucleotide 2'-phosphodiesterase (5'-nucleotidase family)